MSAVILVCAILFTSGFAVLATKDANVQPDALARAELSAGGYAATIALSQPSGKPLILTQDQRALLDVSGWDTLVTVNGTQDRLYHAAYGLSVDGQLAHLTWSHPERQVEERVEATPDGVDIVWSWLRAPDTGPQDATLDIAQFAYVMQNATYADGTVRYRLPASDPRSPAPILPPDPRPIDVTIALDPPPSGAYFGAAPGGGFDSVHLSYHVADPPAGEPVRVFRERVSYVRSDGPPPASDGGAPLRALDASADKLRWTAGDYRADVSLYDGQDRPALASAEGRTLMEISGWESALRVDGVTAPLYRRAFNVTASGSGTLVVWHDRGYSLNESIRLDPDGLAVSWSWWHAPGAPRQLVELDLAHFARYAENLTRAPRSFAYMLTPDDPDHPLGAVSPQPYQVRVDLDREPLAIVAGKNANRTDAVRTIYRLDSAQPGETLLVRERVTYHRGAPVPLDGAVPLDLPPSDPGATALVYDAGPDRASIALDKGADKPLLSAGGRALLEISGWESLLDVNGLAQPLHRNDFEAMPNGASPCLVWSSPAYAIRECVNVTSTDWNLSWSWRRAPDTPAQRVNLTLAHFAYLPHDAGINRTHVDYRLDAADPRTGGEAPADARPYLVHMQLDREPTWYDFAPDAIRLRYALDDPPAGAWTPIAFERVYYDRGAG